MAPTLFLVTHIHLGFIFIIFLFAYWLQPQSNQFDVSCRFCQLGLLDAWVIHVDCPAGRRLFHFPCSSHVQHPVSRDVRSRFVWLKKWKGWLRVALQVGNSLGSKYTQSSLLSASPIHSFACKYRVDFFHVVFALASTYIAMLFSNWEVRRIRSAYWINFRAKENVSRSSRVSNEAALSPSTKKMRLCYSLSSKLHFCHMQVSPNTSQFEIDSGTISCWVKIASKWLSEAIYAWTVVAPAIFPDRNFGYSTWSLALLARNVALYIALLFCFGCADDWEFVLLFTFWWFLLAFDLDFCVDSCLPLPWHSHHSFTYQRKLIRF